MALKIEFEKYGNKTVYNPQRPTFVLLTRSGKKIGVLPAIDETVKSRMNSADEVSFTVYKDLYVPPSAKVFTSEPTTPYHEGDIYIEGYNTTSVAGVAVAGNAIVGRRHTVYVCINTRLSGDYDSDDWSEQPMSVKDIMYNGEDIWESLTSFKLLWCREWNKLFELYVEIEEGEGIIKYVTGTSLGEAELSQINLYDIQINTKEDIEREDYEPTVLYDENNPNASLLNRILEKAPHYSIKHVDSSIASIQRTFNFSNKSIQDSLNEISKEIACIFKIDCYLNSDMEIVREISAYDLNAYCVDCGYRGNFVDVCPECESTNVLNGYGEDTTIFVSVENLTDEIKYTTDTGAVKNCFKLEAGDDLMTSAIRFVNPNGTDYIWNITDDVKEDMSDELSSKIDDYNDLYSYYYNEYEYSVASLADDYNDIIDKYSVYSTDYPEIDSTLVGYPAISEAYFNTVDFYYYLHDSLMPNVTMSDTTASTEAAKLTAANLSPIAVTSLASASSATVENAVLGMAKVIVDSRYKVTATTSSYASYTWTGYFTVTNYSDEDDTATSSSISITINADYETYLYQKIDKSINKRMTEEDEANDVVGLFQMNLTDFTAELEKYSLTMLLGFRDCCQTCLDVLIEQGVADAASWASAQNDLYTNMYVPYRNKLAAIDSEIATRSSEIDTVIAMQNLLTDGMASIKEELNFEEYLGSDLWLEFSAYRREYLYQNSNYITDGLTNKEIISYAKDFVKEASEELYKSSTLQHSITSTLQNLLVMEEFQPLVDYFENGNWLRIRVDGKIYKLRMLEYEINYNDIGYLPVTFSDVLQVSSGISDIESVLSKASSMATSYDATTRQAKQGNDGANMLDNWVDNGLSLTTVKIVNTADDQNITWDEHGLLAREYDDILDSYDDKQLKIINRGLYVTNDGWETSKAGIGEFTFWNPQTQQTETGYGVIADTLVGSLILGQSVGVYNTSGSIQLDDSGISVSNSSNSVLINPSATYLLDVTKGTNHLLYLDSNGDLNVSGKIYASSGTIGGFETDDESIHTAGVSIESFAENSVGLSSSTFNRTINGTLRQNLKFAIGANCGITSNGSIYLSSGEIAGWVINGDGFYHGNTIKLYTGNTYAERVWMSASNYNEIRLSFIPTVESGLAAITTTGDILADNIYFEGTLSNTAGQGNLLLRDGSLTQTILLDGTTGRGYFSSNGAANNNSYCVLNIGNDKPKTQDGHSTGDLRLYGYQKWSVELYPVDTMTANRYIRIPDKDGTIALTSQAVSSITASGMTCTATRADGTTFTFTPSYSPSFTYVSSQGYSGNYYYRIWSNKWMEVWGYLSGTININSAWGNVYEGQLGYFTFPYAFSGAPYIQATISHSSNGVWIESTGTTDAYTSPTYWVCKAAPATSVYVGMNIYAAGFKI